MDSKMTEQSQEAKEQSQEAKKQKNESGTKDINYRLKAGIFLTSVSATSALIAFGMTLAAAKKKDPMMFAKGSQVRGALQESGVELAMRALKWGTIYAVSGTSLISYGIWKLSGASDMKDFRQRMGRILPRISKNNPPVGRTEFSGLNDLLNYVSNDYSKDSKHSTRT